MCLSRAPLMKMTVQVQLGNDVQSQCMQTNGVQCRRMSFAKRWMVPSIFRGVSSSAKLDCLSIDVVLYLMLLPALSKMCHGV